MPVTSRRPIASNLEPGDHPYLTGAWTPLHEEIDLIDPEVIGTIPHDIDGVYLRNTENQVMQPLGRYHPFDGDGMLHAIIIANGRAEYRNRIVPTRGLLAEQQAGQALWAGLLESPKKSQRLGVGVTGHLKDASSTDVVVHGGMALSTFYQCGQAYQFDPFTLECHGPASWVPAGGISAHCKTDQASGELLFFNYSASAPYLHYGVLNQQGQLTHYVPIDLPGPRLPHDLAFSAHYTIFNDLPLFADPELAAQQKYAVRFYPNLPSRWGLLPRHGQPHEVRWFESQPTYVLHYLNAYEDGDEVILDGYYQEQPMPERPSPHSPQVAPEYMRMAAFLDQYAFQPRLHRWRFNLKTGQTSEAHLDERLLEFGTFNQDYAGRKYRYAYSAIPEPGWFLFCGLVKHDLETGESSEYRFGPNRFGSEAPFVPRINAQDEDDGYLISFVTDLNTQRSECVLLDAKNITAGPVCRILLPHQISSGTHACWADGAAIRAAIRAAIPAAIRAAEQATRTNQGSQATGSKRNGIPLLEVPPGAAAVTLETVNRLRDELP